MTALLLLLALSAPLQPPRLLVLGDSIGYGLSASAEDKTYRMLLASALGATLTFTRTTTVDDVPEDVGGFDYIVLEIGLNDATLQLIPEDEWPAAYGAALDRLQATGATVIAATPFPVFAPDNVHYATVERYAGYIRQEAGARGIGVADLWTIDCCISQPDEPGYLPPYHGDGFHPSDEGHARIAYLMLRAARPYALYFPIAT
jgi:GDSL-like lipase/acylhydrolase family protein